MKFVAYSTYLHHKIFFEIHPCAKKVIFITEFTILWKHPHFYEVKMFSRPLFTIIFMPKILLFVTYSILSGQTKVEFVIYWVLRSRKLCKKELRGKKSKVVKTQKVHTQNQLNNVIWRVFISKDVQKLNYLIYTNFFQPVISLLEAKAIGFHRLVTRPLYEMPVGIGLLAVIIAVKCAWTWSVLRARLNKILFLVWWNLPILTISTTLADFAMPKWRAVMPIGSSPLTLMDGFGPAPSEWCPQLTSDQTVL